MSYSYRSSRRRSRYTVTVEKNGFTWKRVVLAYDPEGAGDHYRRLGYVVGTVTKGDYRKTEPAQQQPQHSGGFTINRAALKDACDLLGLKLPVKIRFNGRHGRTLGNYRFKGTHHDIMLKSYHDPEQASSTLWHELTHAMQAERAGSTMAWNAVLSSSRGLYRACPLEIEARDMQATMADVSLCR